MFLRGINFHSVEDNCLEFVFLEAIFLNQDKRSAGSLFLLQIRARTKLQDTRKEKDV
jgi:hypothetical protein